MYKVKEDCYHTIQTKEKRQKRDMGKETQNSEHRTLNRSGKEHRERDSLRGEKNKQSQIVWVETWREGGFSSLLFFSTTLFVVVPII